MPPKNSWREAILPLINDDQLERLVCSRPVDPSMPRKIVVRPVQFDAGPCYQAALTRGSQEFHENLDRTNLVDRLADWLDVAYQDVHVFTKNEELVLRRKPNESWKIKRKAIEYSAASRDHNREKQYLIPANLPCPFLIAAGIMTAQGTVKPNQAHKFRQINRYLEFVNDLIGDLPQTGTLRVVDYGSGKSSLTYAVHFLLTEIHHREVEIVGLDTKAEVLDSCEAMARKLNLTGLSFQHGTIAQFTPAGPIHLAISLHACDTATDDALACALAWNANAILAVPCCQHELNHRLSATVSPGMLQFGLVRERFASLATDALRACFLEAAGYSTQLLEFVEMEHTPKNILIRAVRKNFPSERLKLAATTYDGLKQALQLPSWALETACASRQVSLPAIDR